MKAKLLGFIVALLSVATIGIVQLQSEAATPGQVGNAPRCTATAIGPRGQAFTINGNTATVKFKVTGRDNCRVQLSSNSFYAPSMNGKPYSKQILYQRVTKIYKPGTYSMSVGLPPSSTKAKGCYYQVDLTYGTHNVTPVLAYGHGKLDCGEKKPSAACKALTVTKLERTKFRFNGSATVKDGAKVRSYTFVVYNQAGRAIYRQTAASPRLDYTQATPGTYTVSLTVNTTVGPKTGKTCVKQFTVTKPPVTPTKPGVEVKKTVEQEKYKQVGVNVEYEYQIAVTNTGDIDLKNVKVTDTPVEGISLVDASAGTIENNTWTHTIPELKKGQTLNFTITAKVPVYKAGMLKNTVCVDAPEVPGTQDDCDSADVDVPAPGKTKVCNPETGEIITVNEDEADQYVPVGDAACVDTPTPEEPTPTEPVPTELPTTGPLDTLMQLTGAVSLTGALAYYIASRRLS